MTFRPISTGFAPNFESDDVRLAVKLLLGMVSQSTLNSSLASFKKEFSEYFGGRHVSLYSSGRAALCGALRALNLEKDSEVLIQAFTCVAVPDAVLWADLKPIFVDISPKTYNFDIKYLKKKLSKKTRAIVIQHTFGISADISELKKIAEKNNLYLVEDCAHGLGGEYGGEKLGTLGDIGVFSFGRDKIISSVFGGAVVTKNKQIIQRLMIAERDLVVPPGAFTQQQLQYLVIYALALPVYNLFLGKGLLWLSRRLGLLSQAVYERECRGEKPFFLTYRFSLQLAPLLLQQFRKLPKFIKHRKSIANIYIENLGLNYPIMPYLRVPVIVKDKTATLAAAKRKGIHLGNWYRGAIDPPHSDGAALNYTPCPQAESLAQQTINLPTHINISRSDALKIAEFIKKSSYEKP